LNRLVHRNLDSFSHLFREDGRDKVFPVLKHLAFLTWVVDEAESR
jgi:hypothetical protein